MVILFQGKNTPILKVLICQEDGFETKHTEKENGPVVDDIVSAAEQDNVDGWTLVTSKHKRH